MKKRGPPHLYLEDTWYMLTAAVHMHAPILVSDTKKALVRDTLRHLHPEFGCTLRAWVILDDHYHLLLKFAEGQQLPAFIQRLHGSTARQINLWDATPGRKVWYSYWDTCLRSEQDMWTRFNYIHSNPVKHGYVSHPDAWPYSSYHYYLRTRGSAWLADSYERYPVLEHVQGDDFLGPRPG
jgi:putative transposase